MMDLSTVKSKVNSSPEGAELPCVSCNRRIFWACEDSTSNLLAKFGSSDEILMLDRGITGCRAWSSFKLDLRLNDVDDDDDDGVGSDTTAGGVRGFTGSMITSENWLLLGRSSLLLLLELDPHILRGGLTE